MLHFHDPYPPKALDVRNIAAVMKAFRVVRAFPGFVWAVAKQWYHGGLGDLAAGVVFWFLITIPAVVLGLVSALGFLEGLVGTGLKETIQQDVVDFIQRVFTADADSLSSTVDELFGQTNGSFLALSIGLTLFTISRGFSGMIRALDTVYDVVDGRTWYHTRIVGLILGLGSVLIAVPIVLLEVFVWSEVDFSWESPVKAVIAIVILLAWAATIFHFGPATRTKWRWDLPGAVVAAAFWWALSFGFNVYVEVVGQGTNEVLGAIGAFILALTWIWLAAQVLLIGAAVNAILGDRMGLDRGRRPWKISEAIANTTGEIKKVVLPEPKDLDVPLELDLDDAGEGDPKARRARMKTRTRAPRRADANGADANGADANGADANGADTNGADLDRSPIESEAQVAKAVTLASALPEKPLATPLDLSRIEADATEPMPFFDLDDRPMGVGATSNEWFQSPT